MNQSVSEKNEKGSLARLFRFGLICCLFVAWCVWMILPPMETFRYRKFDEQSQIELALPMISLSDVGERPVVVFSADGQSAAYLASPPEAADDERGAIIEVIEVATGKKIGGPYEIARSRTPPHLAISRDGHFLAAAGSSEVRVWDLGDSRLVNSLSLADVRIQTRRYVAISPDGKRIATSNQDGDEDPALIMFETESGRVLTKLERTALTANDNPFAFHPTANQLIGTGEWPNGVTLLCVWDAETGKVVREIFAEDDGQTLAFDINASGNRIAIAMFHGARKYAPFSTASFDLQTWQPLIDMNNEDYVFWVSFRPGDSQICIVDASGTASIWSTGSGLRLQNFQLGLASATAFSRQDGALHLVTNASDKMPLA